MSTSTPLRAGDLERDATAAVLAQAMTEGYLDVVEYDARLQAVYDAATTPDLGRLTADLPVGQLRRNDPRRRAARRAAVRRGVQLHLAGYLTMVAIVLTVWMAVGLSAGSWYFWPIWPIMGAGIGLVAHTVPVRLALPGCPVPRRGGVRGA